MKKAFYIIALLCIIVAGLYLALTQFWPAIARLAFGSNSAGAKAQPGLKELPCTPASQVELGYPSLMNRKTAEFTTAGGSIYVKPRQIQPGGGGWTPSYSTVEIIVGLTSNPPIYDEQKGKVINVDDDIEFDNKNYGQLKLSAGRYWIWATGGGDIVLYSCEPDGVSDPKPVR